MLMNKWLFKNSHWTYRLSEEFVRLKFYMLLNLWQCGDFRDGSWSASILLCSTSMKVFSVFCFDLESWEFWLLSDYIQDPFTRGQYTLCNMSLVNAYLSGYHRRIYFWYLSKYTCSQTAIYIFVIICTD